ncbi:MAG: ribosomal protein S18-alanine N-acetyltransferase [Desulfuromonadales bacterium]|nr:ribosomal protein S18-alanine N-acetyltransferase [Desulfuromonadales bacterium]
MKYRETVETSWFYAMISPAMTATDHDRNTTIDGLSAVEVIRPMTVDDLPQVHLLECAAQSSPWSLEHFAEELGKTYSRTDLCWRDGQLAGFICTWLIADELQIQNVATSPEFRRQGVAARLLTYVFGRCRDPGFEAAWLEVRVSNAPAIALYERFGFTAVGRRPNYYADGEEALVMCYKPERSEE